MRIRRISCIAALCLAAAGCAPKPPAPAGAMESAPDFVARLNSEMATLADQRLTAEWVEETYLTEDTQRLAAQATDRYLAYYAQAVTQAATYAGQPMEAATARALEVLKHRVSAAPPKDPAKRARLAALLASLEAAYGEAKSCGPVGGKSLCRNIDEFTRIMAQSRNYTELTEAWTAWHATARPIRRDYEEFVALANEGARDLGYDDQGAMWRAGYDMTPQEFARETDRLWAQVQPLYGQLQCYARVRLTKKYGAARVPPGRPIPAQLLGNLWAQTWNTIYPDILVPYPHVPRVDVDRQLKAQGYDALRMTRQAQSFYESLGFEPLPATFWQRSMLTRPRDREVVCHASAWQMNHDADVRIKTCLTPTQEDLSTVYHEMGHLYYDLAYRHQPFLFQGGANDGFHEAIGDTIVLSMTPAYLASVHLAQPGKPSREALINEQMRLATERVAFLPFAKLIDEWRWGVFSGAIKPEDYNKAWWALREKYQGVAAPVARSEADFDPGAKYHVPGNTPYMRYFLSYLLQFQFHKALCEAAGFKGPLYECSIAGSRVAGERFRTMLAAGESEPWSDTLEKLTGTRRIDASAILEYFQPLLQWLKQANAGEVCGWDGANRGA